MKIAKIIGAAITLGFGIWAVVAPVSVMAIVGWAITGAHGITEARVTIGAVYLGSGAYCLWKRTPEAFRTLGAGYCAMALTRIVAMLVDHSADSSNFLALATEAFCGLVMVL